MADPQPIRPRPTDERRYLRELRRTVLDPAFLQLRAGIATAQDAAAALAALNAIEPFVIAGGLVDEQARSQFMRINRWHRLRLIRTFQTALAVDITPLLPEPAINAWMTGKVAENVDLIRTIPPRLRDGVRADLLKLQAEAPFDRQALARVLRENYQSSGYNVRRITRDQTSKAVGQLTEIRQRQLGIEEYQWLTARDERVRPTHQMKDGRTFRWDSPPPDTGPPGQDIQCRCVARAKWESRT